MTVFPPASPSAGPTAPQLPTPSLRRRLASWLYEGMILFGVVFVAGYLFGALTQTKHGLQNRTELQFFVFVVLGIYFSWFWAKGQTIAMKTWHIRLLSSSGAPVSQWRAAARYAASWVWLLPPMALGFALQLKAPEILVLTLGWVPVYALLSRFAPGQQFWHDILCGTRLVDAQPQTKKPT